MASAKEHAVIGAGVGAVTWFLYCKLFDRPLELGELLVAAGVGLIGGVLPDLLEPALHPNHRRFCHSVGGSALLACLNNGVSRNTQIPAEGRAAVHLISLGFFSHLIADSQTPKGLPWV